MSKKSLCSGHPDTQPPRLNIRSWLWTPKGQGRCTVTNAGDALHNIEVKNRNKINSLQVQVTAWSWTNVKSQTNVASWRREGERKWEKEWIEDSIIIGPGKDRTFRAHLRCQLKTSAAPRAHNEQIVIECTWGLPESDPTYWPSFVFHVDFIA